MIVHQTLHGYKDGHRLLAGSIALSPADERRMDALSDLSGYLDRAVSFSHYHTGYPCAGSWVLARTWIDEQAERRGTVFTHSLLLPLDGLAELSDLARIASLFRKPTRPLDLSPYRAPLTLQPLPVVPLPTLDPASRRALALACFGQDARPILWEDPATAEAAARQVWAWLPPWLRRIWSFCTVALQPRYLGDDPLDWLGVAVPGSTVFYKLQDRALRVGGRVPVPPPPDPTWLPVLLDRPPDEVQRLWTRLRDGGFGEVPAPRLRLLLQHEAMARREDLSARLAQLDVLERLGVGSGPIAEQDVGRAIEALNAAEPSLAALHDLLVRAPHRRAPALRDEIASGLARALTRRRAPPGPEELKRLPALLRDARGFDLVSPIKHGLIEQIARTEDPLPWLRALMPDEREIASAALVQIEPGRLGPLVPELLRDSALIELGARLSLDRPSLLADLLRGHAGTDTSRNLLALLWSANPDWSRGDWSEVLGAVDPDDLLASLAPDCPPLPEPLPLLVARRIAPEHDLPDLVERTPSWLHERLFEAQVERSPDRLTRRSGEVLRWLAGSELRPESRLLRQLVESAAIGDLRAPPLAAWLARGAAAESAGSRLLPVLTREVLDGVTSLEELGPWLRAAGEDLSARPVREVLAGADGRALHRAVAILALPEARALRDRTTLERGLEAWFQRSAEELQQEPQPWLDLLKVLRGENWQAHHALCILLLRAVVDTPRPEGAPLAEATFGTIHDALCEDTKYDWINPFKWIAAWWGYDWDKAKHLRENVAAAWVRGRWPPETLLRLADKDADLLTKLIKRALERPGGAEAVARLRRSDVPAWARRALFL